MEARCRERGYTLAEVAECVVSRDGDYLEVDIAHPKYPRPGLGDRVQKTLKSVGITEERVAKVLGKPCGCNGRRLMLNKLGRSVMSAITGRK